MHYVAVANATIIKEGMQFNIYGDVYLLALIHTNDQYCLINIENGNRWRDPGTLDDMARQLNEAKAKVVKAAKWPCCPYCASCNTPIKNM